MSVSKIETDSEEERAFLNKIGTPNARKTVTSTWVRNHANLCTLTRHSHANEWVSEREREKYFPTASRNIRQRENLCDERPASLILSGGTRVNSFFANKQIRLPFTLITLRRAGRTPENYLTPEWSVRAISSGFSTPPTKSALTRLACIAVHYRSWWTCIIGLLCRRGKCYLGIKDAARVENPRVTRTCEVLRFISSLPVI